MFHFLASDSYLLKLIESIASQKDMAVFSKTLQEGATKMVAFQENFTTRLKERIHDDKAKDPSEDIIDEQQAQALSQTTAEEMKRTYNGLIEASNELVSKGYVSIWNQLVFNNLIEYSALADLEKEGKKRFSELQRK